MNLNTKTQWVSAMALVLPLFTSACNGDDGAPADDGAASTGTDPDSDDSDVDDGTLTASSDGADSTGAGETDADTDAGTDAGTTGDDEGTSTGEIIDEGTYAALVRGELFTDDIAMAQGLHDQIAAGGERGAMALGDFGHDAKLGTTLLGSPENAFLGLDQWDNLAGAQALYSDPDFGAAFGMLFAAQPSLELFELREEWHNWGDLQAGDGGDHWFVVVRGTLVSDDIEAVQAMHDGVAAGGQDAATAAGDVAHVVWLGAEGNPTEFFAVDVWNDDTNIEAFYGNPEFQAAFGALFDGPPSVAVYASTDWYQW